MDTTFLEVYGKAESLVRELAAARKEVAEARATIQALQEQFQERPEVKAAYARLKAAEERVTGADRDLREISMYILLRSGRGAMHPATGVRYVKRVKYSEQDAISWCITNLPNALSLNTRLFEKHALAVAETSPIPCVVVEEVPQVTIATDLSQWET